MTSSNTASTNHFTTTKVKFTFLSGHKTVNVLLPSNDDNFVEEDYVVNVSLSLTGGCCVVSPASIQIESSTTMVNNYIGHNTSHYIDTSPNL